MSGNMVLYLDGTVPPTDLDHKRAVEQKVVPAACIMSGPSIALAHAQGADPCQRCPVERERCGGRPRGQAGIASKAIADVTNSAATAYKLTRDRYRLVADQLYAFARKEQAIAAEKEKHRRGKK